LGYRIGTAPVSFSPTLHHHLGTRVETRAQIEAGNRAFVG
jgi:hypothetical protein